MTVSGQDLEEPQALLFSHPGVKAVDTRMLQRMRTTARPALQGGGMDPLG